MYSWYRRSSVCYVYLSDFSFSVDQYAPSSIHNYDFLGDFKQTRWFRRGWTLQELLALFSIELYDKDWRYIGDKVELGPQISAATGIDEKYFLDWNSASKASVAAELRRLL